MRRIAQALCAALAATLILTPCCWAQQPFQPKGTILKYSQPIGHLVEPNNMSIWGEDIPSDVDWNKIMMPSTSPIPPNWVIADDFRDPFDTPVRTVRWWGSYPDHPTVFQNTPTGPVPVPPGPGVEDGYVISFFTDVPVSATNPFSHPGDLLGTYVLPIEKVGILPTSYQGWDMRPIFEYRANLMDAHLDHPSTLADSMGFNQKPGEIYWISIIAEVGHKLELVDDPAGGPRWISTDTGKFAEDHYWGWHTSPVHFNDVATMGHLAMPGNEWLYGEWMRIQPQHNLFDMAFELYTIPEPASVFLMLVAVAATSWWRRRST